MSNSHRANRLISETSPYLLQHAYNPVDWYPWGNEALERAKAENKLILVSIGYSACHWCHVMERECFEDAEVAQLMNAHFINIKLDREERPDIDAIYMDAVQLMRGTGGWPLNCFLLPDGRPIYGGTYFPKAQWMSLLAQLAEFWRDKPDKALEYGQGLTEAIAQMETAAINADDRKPHTPEDAARVYIPLSQLFDKEWGGTQREPKFPLPVFWQYILRYAHFSKDLMAESALELTLRRMAWGGIYDAVGGGFSRYSVDGRWHVPHFEKMLYDNAQLISLYSEAYRRKPDPLYAKVIRESVDFVLRELTSPEGGFYSALDADSEGVEGKFYVWTQAELNRLLGDRAPLFAVAYNTSEAGNWEHGLNVLMRTQTDADIAQAAQLSLEQVEAELTACKQILFAERSKRTRPGLDDKVLVAWNGLMLKALVDASRALGEPAYMEHAKRNASFLAQRHLRPDGGLWRTSKGEKAHINAYLDDYAFYIKALVALYQATFDATYLEQAKSLMLYAIEHFQDTEKGFFFYTSDLDDPLIARKKELYDSVIPSSNAIMAHALLTMGHYFDRIAWLKMAHHMLDGMVEQVQKHGSMFASWAMLHLRFAFPEFQFAINGPQALEFRAELDQAYLPNVLPVGAFSDSRLPLLRNKYVEGKTKIYVCKDRACEMPVDTVEAALKQIGHSMGQA